MGRYDGVIPNQPAWVVMSGALLRACDPGELLKHLRAEGIGPSASDEYVFISREYFDRILEERRRITGAAPAGETETGA